MHNIIELYVCFNFLLILVASALNTFKTEQWWKEGVNCTLQTSIDSSWNFNWRNYQRWLLGTCLHLYLICQHSKHSKHVQYIIWKTSIIHSWHDVKMSIHNKISDPGNQISDCSVVRQFNHCSLQSIGYVFKCF